MWKDQVNFAECLNFKLLVAVDILESFFNCLNSFYKTKQFFARNAHLGFEPFTAGIKSLSYQEAEKFANVYKGGRREQCRSTMTFAETEYVDDMTKRGITLPEGYTTMQLVQCIRIEAKKYPSSKVKHARNDDMHIFSRVIHQDRLSRECCDLSCKGNHATIFSLTDVPLCQSEEKMMSLHRYWSNF